METSATGSKGNRRLSDESAVSPTKPESTASVKPAQNFEWIQHGDASARKRARAHVTRGFRRQKKDEAKKRKDSSDESEGGSPPEDTTGNELINTPIVEPWDRSSSGSGSPPTLDLGPTLGSGGSDPFGAMPIELNPETHALLDHFLSGVAPVSYRQDTRASFQPVKALTFEVALSAPPAFHVILSSAANDIAALHGRQESRESIMHRGKALALVSKSLARTGPRPGDDTLAAVALFTGYELLFGTPQEFNTHMDGLTSLLDIRGGLETLQAANPTLHQVISWFDYSGSCNLVAIRRFVPPTQEFDILSTNPSAAPDVILRSLPDGYDLRRTIGDLFRGLKTVAYLLWGNIFNATQRAESAAFISRVDSDLYRSICTPEQEGNRSRRRYVLQSYHLLILIATALVSKTPKGVGSAVGGYLDFLEIVITTESERWGNAVMQLLRFLFSGVDLEAGFDIEVKKVIDVSIMPVWDEWRNVKKALLSFFVDDEACEGRLQTLWKGRITAISAQIS